MKILVKKSQAKEPYTFSFLGADGSSVVRSENYAVKKSCMNGIESVRKNSQAEGRYDLAESKNGKFFFNLKATNGQVVATSSLFASVALRSEAMAFLKAHAPAMPVEEVDAD
uniref:YegP family protein n=1 Tax=Marinobacterium profundum TaxID=1714300 RepID=UPI00082F2D2C|nr:YegP family protein [Marinobacterium profundum]